MRLVPTLLLCMATVLSAFPCNADKMVSIRVDDQKVRAELPATFFSFNVNYFNFQNDYVDPRTGKVAPAVIDLLREFKGSYYRYPGGTIANDFDWRSAVGPYQARRSVKPLKWAQARPVRFGLEEYQSFLESVGGRPWYVLNLTGFNEKQAEAFAEDDQVAASNGELARLYSKMFPGAHYYQLGNELDRSQYEWPVERYVSRSKATMSAISKADPDAKFVPFLRDFDWKYRTRPGSSPGPAFSASVMKQLAEAQDFSLQIYYDTPSEEGRKSDIAWRERLIKKTISAVQDARNNKKTSVWITEHARANPRPQTAHDIEHTSGMDGAISSADFILAMAQVPEVQGMFWHALGGGKWQLIQLREGGVAIPTPIYSMLKLLRQHSTGVVLDTRCGPESDTAYEGGYDIRATAFDSGNGRFVLWVVNRSADAKQLNIRRKSASGLSLKGTRMVLTQGRDGALSADLRSEQQRVDFDGQGSGFVTIPGRAVAVFTFI